MLAPPAHATPVRLIASSCRRTSLTVAASLRAARRSLVPTALIVSATSMVMAGCAWLGPGEATPPIQLMSTSARLVGDGFQHGPPGSPTYDVIRDGARTAVMPDGFTLQVNADTMSVPTDPTFFFQTNSASLSPPGNARTTLDHTKDERPIPLLPWTQAEQAQVVNGVRYVGVWPTGVTWVPDGVSGGNRVLITYDRVFTNLATNPTTFNVLGTGVAEYRYPGAYQALADGIQATRLNDDLFPGDDVAMGSPVYADGWVYLYGCNDGSVACHGARVRPDQVATPGAWKWWDGSDYNASRHDRKDIEVGEYTSPSVQFVPSYNAYAMSNSRSGNELVVRWSTSPAGPWSEPQIVTLPACGESLYSGGCYGQSIRPESNAHALVVTYAPYGNSRTRVAAVPVKLATG